MTELEQLCENALYDEMRVLDDGKSVVRDIPTGKLYFKKALDVYNEQVFAYLRDHKNRHVAAVQAYWKEGEKLVVIEELIQGRTLDEMLKADETSGGPGEADGTTDGPAKVDGTTAVPLTFAERVDILTQICDGLEFLHSADPPIIHRDIKASNIMVTDDFVVKIIDYDAAKIYVTGQTKDTMMIGTQGLAAPEQYGFAQSDVRTDLYALGKLVERMLPGNVDAKRITDKATEMDPKKRYASAAQMKAHIQRIREKTSALDRKFEKIPGFDPMNKSHRIRARQKMGLLELNNDLTALGYEERNGSEHERICISPLKQGGEYPERGTGVCDCPSLPENERGAEESGARRYGRCCVQVLCGRKDGQCAEDQRYFDRELRRRDDLGDRLQLRQSGQ